MIKRIFDFTVAAVALLLFLPFGLVIAAVLRLTGEGKIFYHQPRVGRHGKTFRVYKFATMLENSPNLGSGDVTLKDDPRVLPAGKWLRKTKLNEVPQLLNVLMGHMSLVGPRPLTAKNFAFYASDVQATILTVRPGLTGLGSIVFRDEERIISQSNLSPLDCYAAEIAPRKATLEVWYVQNQSLWLDLKILLLTAWVVVAPRGALPLSLIHHEFASFGWD